jgi:hypothetical protein
MTSSLRNHPSNPPPGAAPKSGLTVSKVVAGAGAAVTTAVVGSTFGADGTVVGAAVGSIVSAVAAAAYERSLDRTRQIVVARVRPVGARGGDATQVFEAEVTQVIPTQRLGSVAGPTGPTPRPGVGVPSTGPTQRLGSGAQPTGSVAPAPPPSRRMRLPLLAGATVVVFLVGLLIVTGIELFTGGPVLSSNSQRGTSVGTLLGSGSQSSTTTTEAAPTTAAAESATPEPSSSLSPSKRRAAEAEASSRAAAEGSATPSATAAPRARNAVPVTPTAPPALLQQQDG